ncbi:MAG: TonB-dependent siderophore receptor [Pseudomonas sp.]
MPRTLLFCACLTWLATPAFASGTERDAADPSPTHAKGHAAASAQESVTDLSAVHVRAEARAEAFQPQGPAAVSKSDVPLERTPMSIDVLTRGLLDSQQVLSLNEALQNSAGVVGGTFGRRGWDDFIIRGQTASDSLFLDGLRTAASNRVAEQLHGLQQLEVLKGPASLLYGQVLPGGLVNMVSKRPQAGAFVRGELSTGSHGLRQGALDVNQPLAGGKATLRVDALAKNADDATDHVWSRERWIAPSLAFDLGPDSDFVVLTSYQQRRYVRQQGLPLEGSVYANPNGRLRRSLFTGEPGQQPYEAEQERVGYQFDHRFGNGWKLHHGLRWQQYDVEGEFVTNNGVSSDGATLSRSAQHQHWHGRTWVQDSYLSRHFDGGALQHELTVGLDAYKTWEWTRYSKCSVAKLSLYAPSYSGITCPATRSTDNLSVVSSGGLYLRDQIGIGERWQLLLGARHDRSEVETRNYLTDTRQRTRDGATTGSAALMYAIAPSIRPYLSYATSFYPNTGTDVQGNPFDPEKGRQLELGVKFELFGGAATLTAAAYDLRRRNVLEDDPANDGYNIAVGEQRSRGGELSLSADLGSGLSLNAGYAYTDATITDDGGQASSTVGQRLNNVPRNSGSLWLRYDPRAGGDGWSVSGGLRAADARYAYGYTLAGYTLFDAGVGYRRGRWDYALNVRNLFDRDYYAGGLSKAVALGDPRTLVFKLGFAY